MQKTEIVVPAIPAELYRDDRYRVVHSMEEHAQCLAEGWSVQPEDRVYVPHTATAAAPKLAPPVAPPIVASIETGQQMGELEEIRKLASAAPPMITIAAKRPALKLRPPIASQGE